MLAPSMDPELTREKSDTRLILDGGGKVSRWAGKVASEHLVYVIDAVNDCVDMLCQLMASQMDEKCSKGVRWINKGGGGPCISGRHQHCILNNLAPWCGPELMHLISSPGDATVLIASIHRQVIACLLECRMIQQKWRQAENSEKVPVPSDHDVIRAWGWRGL